MEGATGSRRTAVVSEVFRLMVTHNVPKEDEEALQELLDDIEQTVRDDYWNGEWAQSGCKIKYSTGMFRGDM